MWNAEVLVGRYFATGFNYDIEIDKYVSFKKEVAVRVTEMVYHVDNVIQCKRIVNVV